MDFSEVERQAGQLKAQYEAGALSEADFKARLQDLMVQDEQGRWWMVGYETGQWYVHDGEKWVRGEPPRSGVETVASAPPPRPRVATPANPAAARTRQAKPLVWLGVGAGAIVVIILVVVAIMQAGSRPAAPLPAAVPTQPAAPAAPAAQPPAAAKPTEAAAASAPATKG
jgi:hypothetical protein